MDREPKETSKPQEEARPLVPYPFVRGKYGLNIIERIGTYFTKGRIETGSGRRVMGEVSNRANSAFLRIYDEDDRSFLMEAEIHGNIGSANIFTRKKTGERHPDFFARNFLIFALRHFENEGYVVDKFQARWTLTEEGEWEFDNYRQFQKLIREGVDATEAARQTWTGKILSELGFTEIESVKSSDDEIIVFFRKPGASELPLSSDS